ncbi:MAG TPA: hypothetical protein VEK39_07155 [Solirubrobacterales bacterium]|nr:hypothetical protein [Solirubrobacterales bacterium]
MDALVAYLDPGSGSMVLQAILGGIAGFAVALKMFGRRVISFLTFWKRDDPGPAAADSKPDSS